MNRRSINNCKVSSLGSNTKVTNNVTNNLYDTDTDNEYDIIANETTPMITKVPNYDIDEDDMPRTTSTLSKTSKKQQQEQEEQVKLTNGFLSSSVSASAPASALAATNTVDLETGPWLSHSHSSSLKPVLTNASTLTKRQASIRQRCDTTNGHKFANFMKRFRFYNPHRDSQPIEISTSKNKDGNDDDNDDNGNGNDDNEDGTTKRGVKIIHPPDLEKAWYFFEYQCLPRRYTNKRDVAEGRKYARAAPGEMQPTKLYPIIDTPIDDMADFGIGVGMYFRTLRFFGIVTFLAGCISIPTMLYYNSDEYSPVQMDGVGVGIRSYTNMFSAVCTSERFQPCPTCNRDDLTDDMRERLAFSEDDSLAFIMVNQCKLNEVFGIFSMTTMVFVVLSVYLFVWLQRKYRIQLDVGDQTSSDYSVQITNPPNTESARDPETWKTFFEERFEHLHVTVCTVAYKNEELLKLLLQKHKLKTKIRDLLPVTIEYDENNLEELVQKCNRPSFFSKIFCCAKSAEKLYQKILDVQTKIDELLEKAESFDGAYDISNVFVTFESEEMQRLVLDVMKVPKFKLHLVDDIFKFEGQVLNFKEPDEPSSIRWFDLHEKTRTRMKLFLYTFSLSTVMIIGTGFLIALASRRGSIASTVVIISLNTVTPLLVRILTKFESHQSQTSFAASAYIKVTAIRWVNTVLVMSIITPFTEILQAHALLESVHVLFMAELLQRPFFQLVDWMGHIKRHIFGPRAPDQRRMNLWFKSAPYSIGERYTEVTKVLFLTFFYCTLFPLGFFFAAAILFIYYWMDKFCVLRTWRQGPKINADISLLSTYFLWLTLLAYALVAAYTYSAFPFDNACETDEEVPDEYLDYSFNVYNGENNDTTFTISSDDKVYKFCSKDIVKGGLTSFPFIQSKDQELMNESQRKFSDIYGFTFIGVVALVILSILLRLFIRFIKPLFVKTFKPKGATSADTFSNVLEIYGYVPQVQLGEFQYPILLCDVSKIDHGLVGWTGDFKSFNIIYEVPEHLRKSVFSVVKNWHPIEEIAKSPSSIAVDENNARESTGLASSVFTYLFKC